MQKISYFSGVSLRTHYSIGSFVGLPSSAAIVVALGTLLTAGCAGSSKPVRPVSYSQTARANYDKGRSELKSDNHLEALKYFTFVKNKFPFSRYATLAELGIADTYFAQEKHGLAIDAYKLFIKFYPTHPRVLDGYAAYRICEGHVQQTPSDWFLVPPSYEKDQAAIREALSELSGFLRRYPKSPYHTKAQQLHDKTQGRLVAHELYVAKFYLERGKPQATVMRLEGVLKRFAGCDAAPEAMLLLGRAYLGTKQPKQAQSTLLALIEKFPKNENAAKARGLLARLNRR